MSQIVLQEERDKRVRLGKSPAYVIRVSRKYGGTSTSHNLISPLGLLQGEQYSSNIHENSGASLKMCELKPQ
jgi:hypothetical protein